MSDLLNVENLRVEYLTDGGRICVVDGVSFRIGAGEVYGLAGESGSGKSTIAHAILRLLRPPAAITDGRIWFSGRDIVTMSDKQLRALRWKDISLVPQSAMNALNPVMRVRDQITDAIITHERVSPRQALDRAAVLFDVVGIDRARLSSYPHELSGGMRQRVVIAIALALRPKLIIMDEPTTALDVIVQNEILRQLMTLRQTFEFSLLFITHDLALMLQICTRIGVLYAGRLVETAPADVLLQVPHHPYTQGLISCVFGANHTKSARHGIAGTPPDIRHPPAGCRFHPRCSFAMDRCRVEQPSFRARGDGHDSACHLGDGKAP